MSFTSPSKFLAEGQTLVAIKNVSLTLRKPKYSHSTLRDQFVSSCRSVFSGRKANRQSALILDNINLTVSKGDRIGILGTNGQGKTTLCRCIAGFYNPQRGSIRRYGKVRGIFDTGTAIYPELTGRENAKLLMHFLYPEQRRNFDELIEEALHFSELGDDLDSPYRTYSNGMQARLYLSIISCLPADILILDEVFDGADRFFREKISQRVLNLIDTSGAVIFVSHSLDQINRVCNRIVVLDNHRIVFDGDVLEGIASYMTLQSPIALQRKTSSEMELE